VTEWCPGRGKPSIVSLFDELLWCGHNIASVGSSRQVRLGSMGLQGHFSGTLEIYLDPGKQQRAAELLRLQAAEARSRD